MSGKARTKDRVLAGKDASRHRADVYVRVQQRDRGRCRVCDRVTWLQQHHIQFRSALGKDEPENLISLCRECHADIHAGRLKLDGDASAIDAAGRLCGIALSRLVDGAWSIVRYC